MSIEVQRPLLTKACRHLLLFSPQVQRLGVFSLQAALQPATTAEVSQLLYAFRLSHTKEGVTYEWTIKRSYQDFSDFHENLLVECDKCGISAPADPPSLQLLSEVDESANQLLLLETYLKRVTLKPSRCQMTAFLEFVEVSALSFDGKSTKRKEGYLFKRTGGRVANEDYMCNCTKYFKRFQKRWLMIRDDMVGYVTRPQDERLHEALTFKGKFVVFWGKTETGFDDGIKLVTNTRAFLLRTGNTALAQEWYSEIVKAYSESDWAAANCNRYNSSFPVRPANSAKWYVDGEDYFRDVCTELQKAKSTVYISDWWLSPELLLERPASAHPATSILEVLGKLADRKVNVYIHVYKEVSLALTLNSLHTKQAFKQRSNRIRIIRHPHRSIVGRQFLWSHHEKVIVIDHYLAFLGGLDLCFGRWDTSKHSLREEEPSGDLWPGIDYSNCRIADFTDVENASRDSIDRRKVPRMPWHDVALRVTGSVANDLAHHFTELWNHVMTDRAGNYHTNPELLQPATPHMQPNTRSAELKPYAGPRGGKSESSRINLPKLMEMERHVVQVERFPLSRTTTAVLGEETAPDQPILRPQPSLRADKRPFKSMLEMEQLEEADEQRERQELMQDKAQGDEQFARNLLVHSKTQDLQTGSCTCQLVVSSSMWSYNYHVYENTIYSAYLHLINLANHFIYIENQFFISSTAGDPVKNQLAQALVDRIKYAFAHKEAFKVIVVMPLLPAFEGSVDDPAAAVLRVQLYWEYQTISSLYEQLKQSGIEDPTHYIAFYGLRTHAVMPEGNPATEIVYVHSKVMIVDDCYALIGSANINDRSLLGDRDSEVALVVEDSCKVPSRLAGKEVQAAQFALSLRLQLFKEHSGGSEDILRDPLSDEFDQFWRVLAHSNTVRYRHVFRCYPDDCIPLISELAGFQAQESLEAYPQLCENVKGFLVEFPLRFLAREDLKMSIFSKEYYVPDINFV